MHGLQVVVAAEDELGAQRCEGVEGLRRVGEAVASGELAPDGVVVDHDHAGGVGGGGVEGGPGQLDVGVLDVPDHAEVPEASRYRAPRYAVGRVQAGDDRPRNLERAAEILRDEPLVPEYLNSWA